MYGLDFDNPIKQNDFRVIYHENIDLSIKEEDIYDLGEDVEELIEEFSPEDAQHKIGGHPHFTQNDPRDGEKHFKKFDMVLLQIDSEENEEIMWGDLGVANLFINSEDLKNKNFSEVLYNWDCS